MRLRGRFRRLRLDRAEPEEVSLLRILDGPPEQWLEIEAQMDADAHPLVLQHRPSFLVATGVRRAWLILLGKPDGRAKGAVAVSLGYSRALPGFLIADATRFGSTLPPHGYRLVLQALAQAAFDSPRVLRVHLDVVTPEADARLAVRREAERVGFRLNRRMRSYARTPMVDLSPDEDTLLQSFERMVRRNVKKSVALGHVVRPVEDPGLAPRLAALLRETMGRTAGPPITQDWRALIEYSRAWPSRSRIAGLFLNGAEVAASLVAFRWCGNHGDHVEDLVAASTRLDPPVPLMHSVMWDMLRWSKRCGARWFDFGGIPEPDVPPSHPLMAVAAFKRLFTKKEITIREELTLVSRPLANRIAEAVSALGSLAVRSPLASRVAAPLGRRMPAEPTS